VAADHPFDCYVRGRAGSDPRRIDVGEAALLFALDAYPDLDVAGYLGLLDDLAGRVLAEAGRRDAAVPIRWAALRRVLVEQVGLTGRGDFSSDPADWYLNRVLDGLEGLPVSFACVWIAVGQRAGWRLSGLAMPEHFAVCIDGPDGRLLADPFCDGLLLQNEGSDRAESRLPVAALRIGRARRVSNRVTLTHMLTALRFAYLARGDFLAASVVCQRLAALWPDSARRHADLGRTALQAERFGVAVEAFLCALALRPSPAIARKVEGLLAAAGRAWAACN